MPVHPQAKYWILTIPQHAFTPYLPPDVAYIRGQLELGAETGFAHWQLLVTFKVKRRLRFVVQVFGQFHAEPTRSAAADAYVWKEDTAIASTRFELGSKPLDRGKSKDWELIRSAAKAGRLDDIPADVYVRNYNSLKRIAVDHLQPVTFDRKVFVLWGSTGVGKSHRVWEHSGLDAYPKDPRTKYWDGYRGHRAVVIDEFRGSIDIAHLLRWFDKYPVIVEVKGSSVVLCAEVIYITSNLSPHLWYPDLDGATFDALLRRLKVTEVLSQDQEILFE